MTRQNANYPAFPRHICILNASEHPFGAERSLAYLISHIKGQPLCFFLVSSGGATSDLFQRVGVKSAYDLPLRRFRRSQNPLHMARQCIQWLRGSWSLFCLLRHTPTHIVHANGFHSILYALLPALLLRIPLIWHVRDFPTSRWSAFLCAHRAAFLLLPSSALMMRFPRHPKKSILVPNPLFPAVPTCKGGKTEERTPAKPADGTTHFHIGFVGQMIPRKGCHLLLEAFPLILQKIPGARLHLVGNDPFCPDSHYVRQIKSTISASPLLSRHVTLEGYREPADAMFRLFDVVAVPSLEEPFGRVALEAMFWGCPVVAADTGGLVEQIVHKKNGLLFRTGDARDLACKIIATAEDKDLRNHLITGGKETARTHASTVESTAARVAECYKSLLIHRQIRPHGDPTGIPRFSH